MRDSNGRFVKGHTVPEEWRENFAKKYAGKRFSPKTEFTKGSKKHPSGFCFKKGENNPNWKGGITPLYLKIRNSEKTAGWRKQIFERDSYTCTECGVRNQKGSGKSVRLEAHHLKPFWLIIKENRINNFQKSQTCEELWDIDNGITLCRPCHDKTKEGIKHLVI